MPSRLVTRRLTVVHEVPRPQVAGGPGAGFLVQVQVLVADGYQTQFSLAGPAALRLDQVGALDHLSRALVKGR